MARIALLTSNLSARRVFFRAGGIRFIADVLPHLAERHDVEMYVASLNGDADAFEFQGVPVHIVPGRRIYGVDKAFLPNLGLDADVTIFLDYVSALSPNSGRNNAVVFHHLGRSFYDENPALYRKYFGYKGLAYLRIEDRILRYVRGRAPTALLVSDVALPYVLGSGFDAEIVGNGVDVERYRSGRKEDFAVVVGRLVNYKRVDWAIEVSRRTGIPLKVAGTGPELDHLRRNAPENVEFLGYVGEEEKIRLLSRAKYLFAFSAFEGFDLPVIEAMASGAVPIMSDIRAHRFILSGRDAGILVDSVDSAVEALENLDGDRQRYSRLVRRGRELVEEKWNAKRVAEGYLRVIDRLLVQ